MGDLKLHNTRTRSTETFAPIRDGHVSIYVCGLTPSAQAHLGHARSFLFFDVLRRYLEHRGLHVTYVQNVTDIDDRSIARARETGEDWRAIVQGYYDEFKASMQLLGVREPDQEPYATEFIEPMQRMIEQLIEQGHAYTTPDGIYYRVSSFGNYGNLSNRNVSELEAGARIDVDEKKDDPLDFALWKFAKPGEPSWPFEPFGDGRPGWHIECSAMARELLDPAGYGFDIHGGGADLIFPHHENEIAQSEPLMERPPMANFWVHSGLLLFENRKMSKSLGNFEPLSDLLKRHDPQAIRLLFLQTSYSKVMNFTEDSVGAAAATLARLKEAYRTLRASGAPQPTDLRRTGLISDVEAALDEDMNTAVAFSKVFQFATSLKPPATPDDAASQQALYELIYALGLLGIEPNASWDDLPAVALPADLAARLREQLAEVTFNGATPEEAIDLVIAARRQARERKDFQQSDRLRDALLACGIVLADSKEGTTWSVAAAP